MARRVQLLGRELAMRKALHQVACPRGSRACRGSSKCLMMMMSFICSSKKIKPGQQKIVNLGSRLRHGRHVKTVFIARDGKLKFFV
jgi:hypothetical protein